MTERREIKREQIDKMEGLLNSILAHYEENQEEMFSSAIEIIGKLSMDKDDLKDILKKKMSGKKIEIQRSLMEIIQTCLIGIISLDTADCDY